MASQAQIEDEILARRLQSEEFSQRSNTRAANNQTLSDEQLARRLAMEEEQALRSQRATSSVRTQPTPTPAQFALGAGQSTCVRLQHAQSRRQIGEAVFAHHTSSDEMMFELASAPGKYLKARENGVVEFDFGRDATAIFRVENSRARPTALFLVSRAFFSRTNARGGVGWCLSLSAQTGRLCANGDRDAESEWMLVAVSPAVSVPAAGAPQLRTGTVVVSANSNENKFPGFDAGRERLMRFFASPAGREFLSLPDYDAARALYEENPVSLSCLLHRPDWPLLAARYKSYAFPSLALRADELDLLVSAQQLRDFYADGYVVLHGLVSRELVREALKVVNFWTYKHCNVPVSAGSNGLERLPVASCGVSALGSRGEVERDMDVLALYFHSLLPSLAQRLLGADNVAHPRIAQVVSVWPALDLLPSPSLRGDRWWIEGFTSRGEHSPFNLLIGVALTDMDDTDVGNFCVHPGSHIELMHEYRRQVLLKSTLFSANPAENQKQDLGEPTQLRLRAGDVFVCTQRLAYLFAKNTAASPAMFVFFRVSHVEHDIFREPALLSLWLEYKDADRYMDPVLEARSVLTVTEDMFGSETSQGNQGQTLDLMNGSVIPPPSPSTSSSSSLPMVFPPPSVAPSSTANAPSASGPDDNAVITNPYIAHNPLAESVSLLNFAADDESP